MKPSLPITVTVTQPSKKPTSIQGAASPNSTITALALNNLNALKKRNAADALVNSGKFPSPLSFLHSLIIISQC